MNDKYYQVTDKEGTSCGIIKTNLDEDAMQKALDEFAKIESSCFYVDVDNFAEYVADNYDSQAIRISTEEIFF